MNRISQTEFCSGRGGRGSRLATLMFSLTLICGFVSTSLANEVVTVETIEGRTASGTLRGVGEDGSLIGTGFEDLNIEQILSIASPRTVQKSNAVVQLILADGGTLNVANPTVDGESVVFGSGVGIETISMQAVRAIVFRGDKSIRDAIADSIVDAESDKDTVIVDSGDSMARVSGVLESLTDDKLQLNYNGKSRKINREKVAAIVVADLGLKPPTGSMAALTLTDGSTIRGVLRSISSDAIELELTGRQIVSVSRAFFVRLEIDSDSIAFLSSLTPLEASQRPMFTVERPWRKNLSVGGNPLQLRTSTGIRRFENGIGVQSFSRLVFENDRGFSRFLCTAGIDAETNGRGDCVMRVEGDGITLWTQRVRGSDEAIEVDVSIEGIGRIALIVEPGEQFDLADHANWAKARFLKTGN